MGWLSTHGGDVWTLLLQHVWLAAVPLVIGLLVALPWGGQRDGGARHTPSS